ncbi:CBM96 family carbohydrate-binding protein [Paenibacillus silviterrae]|uniref:CBM96 family carbohydrate-binding protein n=1 Tax=Paenibacillus silviterrae TaxID=3242194 RepID=UPI002543ACD5|nr:DNRLRE domain-containing protein [Paenibacillus chinjuensis]
MIMSKEAVRKLAGLLAIMLVLQGWMFHVQIVSASPTIYYVSVNGDDSSGDGSEANPWRTLQKAADSMIAGDTCIVREGVYRETVTPARSGTAEAPITFRSFPGETVTISGAEPLTGWTEDPEASGTIYKAPMAWSLGSGNQLFVNGGMAEEARWPNNTGTRLEPTLAVMSAGNNTSLTDLLIPADVDWVGGTVWFAGGAAWVGQDSLITGFNPADGIMTYTSVRASNSNYDARVGNSYYLSGVKGALDADNEWWYDSTNQELYLQPSNGMAIMGLLVEAKKRLYGLDLSGKSYIRMEGIDLFAASIKTDDETKYLLVDGMKASYISHNIRNPQSNPNENNNGITLRGEHNEIRNSELAYSSGSLLNVKGKHHKIVNNYIHDGNYAGTWNGLISAAGQEHYIGYNTLTRSGRDVMKLDSPNQMIVEYNDFSYGGLVTYDSGLIYTAGDDAMRSEIRYNTLHDMYTHLGMGIYTDNQSSNFIIRHNVIWNVPNADPIRLNSPSNYNLVFNNTAGTNTKGMATWAIVFRGDMFGDRVFNNIFAGGDISFEDSAGVVTGNNVVTGLDPRFVDPLQHDYRLQAGSPAIDAGRVIPAINDGYAGTAPDIGAYEYGQPLFRTGHDFDTPPVIGSVVRSIPPYVNLVRNSGFETGTLHEWTVTSGIAKAIYASGGAWSSETAAMRTQSGGVQLKGSGSEVVQTVAGLEPDTRYTFSLWTKTSSPSAQAAFGVRDYGGVTVEQQVYGADWVQRTFDFTTGPSSTSATVFLGQTGAGGTGNELVELDTLTMPSTASAVLEYNATSYIQAQVSGDGTASLNMKGAGSRTTFALRRSGDKQPKLIVTLAGSSTPIEIAATDSAGVRNRMGTTDADSSFTNPTSFNAANWNSGYQEEFYLKFPLSQLEGSQITHAKLRLYAAGAAAAGAKSTLFGLDEDNWSESTLTWNNKPQALEMTVSYDDIGVILPLDHQSEADALRDVILASQIIYARALADEEFSSDVLDDLALAIEQAKLVASNPAATQTELTAAREELKVKQETLQTRKDLLLALQKANQLLELSTEGALPGQFAGSARTALQDEILLAQEAFEDAEQDRSQLTAVKLALEAAGNAYELRVVTTPVSLLPKIQLDELLAHPQGWSETYTSLGNGWQRFFKDFTRYTAESFGSGVFAWNLKYNFLNIASEWPGILLRSQKPSGPLNQDTTYLFIFKAGVWELQKWVNGKQTVFKKFPNTQFDGTASPVYMGAVNVEGGVRLLCYVEGQPVFDLIDRVDPIYEDGYFGFVSSGQSGDIEAQPLNLPEAALQGDPEVAAGDELVLKLHVSGLSGSIQQSVYGAVYGGSFMVQFDAEGFDYLGAEALIEQTGLQVTQSGGTLNVGWSSESAVRLEEGETVLELIFRAKPIPGFKSFRLRETMLVNEEQTNISVIPLSHRVEVLP